LTTATKPANTDVHWYIVRQNRQMQAKWPLLLVFCAGVGASENCENTAFPVLKTTSMLTLQPISAQTAQDSSSHSEFITFVLQATRELYQRVGFSPPWIGYLAERDGVIVGVCGFKSPPQAGRVEIAYATVPEFQGQGIATELARQMICIAQESEPGIIVTAQTLPEVNASTSILTKLGFRNLGIIQHPEDGPVYDWELPLANRR